MRTIKVYEYEELSDDAKKVALQAVQDGLEFDDVDTSSLSEYFSEWLEELGLPGDDVRWSLNCCQGDGVAFYGSVDLDRMAFLHSEIAPELRYLAEFQLDVSISKRLSLSSYDHWNTMIIEIVADDTMIPERVEKLIVERMETVREYIRVLTIRVSLELVKAGYSDIEYKTSEQEAIETTEFHNYLENGSIYKRYVN